MKNLRLNSQYYIYIFSAVLMLYNHVFCKNLFITTGGILPTIIVILCTFAIFNILFNLIFWRKTVKLLSILIIFLNAVCLYFMHTYNVSIDYVMLLNLLHTDVNEATALLNPKMLLFFIFLVFLPAVIIAKTNITFPQTMTDNLKSKLISCLANIAFLGLIIAPLHTQADNFYREQKHLRYYLLPTNYIGAVISFAKNFQFNEHEKVVIGDDVKIEKYWDNEKKNLIVMIIGESARAANFSLGGYKRNTNEVLLAYQDDFTYFSNAYSCGTATIVSVPCIFSHEDQKHFNPGSELYTENLTDVMKKAEYFTLWRENNTSCQNVCNRIKIEKICKKKLCHDEIMLNNLDEALKNNSDTFLVLHQRGNHGPDYYNMYPSEFERYTPVCKNNDLRKCSKQEVINAYDNSVEYTSYFLAKTIENLQKFAKNYNILMIFASDHGESLGENGIYLHSAVYKSAPDEQKHIPFLIWIPKETQKAMSVDMNCLKKMSEQYISHDNIFHTVLGFAGAQTKLYVKDYDILQKCRKNNQYSENNF